MAISPTCDACLAEMNVFGGILLSPPDDNNHVRKFHVCVDCYGDIVNKHISEKS